MQNIIKSLIIEGVFWVEVPEANVKILCGCPEDTVKHLMLRGLISDTSRDGVPFQTGPNTVLLSDLPLQNGSFSNLAEFPVLQMLYHQGMIIPDHPNNTGLKPILLGSQVQIEAQMQYISRGNYGLTSTDEMIEVGTSPEYAEQLMRMKLRFAFGKIQSSDELLDHRIVTDTPVEIRNGVKIKRITTNVFEISYKKEKVRVNLNMPKNKHYRSPYPLGFQKINREYFSIIHSGQGDGWDTNRPSMASIVVYQGKIYLIDAGPNIAYSLTALGIGVNEIEGIFHTHCHDDHFTGLTSLILTDHKIKYYATPLVRSSVFKKLSALLSISESLAESYFDIQNLELDQWVDIDGLEVRALMSPHPVETTVLFFRTFWNGKYYSYAHLADIASFSVLKKMIAPASAKSGISVELYDTVREQYLTQVDYKKIDIGGGMIHGSAEDFAEDNSGKIILAHQSQRLTTKQKEIGSSAPFGVVDTLIKDQSDNMRRFAYEFLRPYFENMDRHNIRTLLNCPIVEFMPGSIILKKGRINKDIYLILTGTVEKLNADMNIYNNISSGGLIGEHSGINQFKSKVTYRSVSYVVALHLPANLYVEVIKRNKLLKRIERLNEEREFLDRTWLFGESISPTVQNRIIESMTNHVYKSGIEISSVLNPTSVYLIRSGRVERTCDSVASEMLSAGDFFGKGKDLFENARPRALWVKDEMTVCEIPDEIVSDIPVVLWKLLEAHERRIL